MKKITQTGIFCITAFMTFAILTTAQGTFSFSDISKPKTTSNETIILEKSILTDDLDSKNSADVSMVFVGDIMLGRYVETLMKKHGEEYPFLKIHEFLERFETVVANLEGPITKNHRQTPDWTTSFSFAPSIAKLLKSEGIDIVSIANNHTLDKGEAVFEETKQILTDAEIEYVGHPRDIDENYVLEKKINGKKIFFVAFHATKSTFDKEKAIELVKKVSSDEKIFVIVMLHWGIEYQLVASEKQQNLARSLIDAGADSIISHHPHVVQNIEAYNGKIIVYSLGNFIFDQYFSDDTQQGLAIGLELKNEEVIYRLFPLRSYQSQVELMNEEKAGPWLENLAKRSSETLFDAIKKGKIEMKR
ncbi:CapA family protein [Candidatus Peregrinibacteria bacterium]|nr:CapA family protein [Candidatus Peregrinibacteria bacterium]